MAKYKLLVGTHSRMEGESTVVYRRSTDPNNPTIIDLSPREAENLKGRIEPIYSEPEPPKKYEPLTVNEKEFLKPETNYISSPKAEERIHSTPEETKETVSTSEEEAEQDSADSEKESIPTASTVTPPTPDVTSMPLTRVRALLKTIDSVNTVASMYEMEESSKKPRAAVLRVIKERYIELGGEV